MVFDDTRDMVEVAHMAMEFFAEESCGKCFPCRIGTQRLMERLGGGCRPRGTHGLVGRGERSWSRHEGAECLWDWARRRR